MTPGARTTSDAAAGPFKIAIYSLCLNEEAFVKHLTDGCRDADMMIIADTGSADGTLTAFAAQGAVVRSILARPWRLDHTRQAARQLAPEDVAESEDALAPVS